jgi:2-polyprenyl-3-methyl-5-hydroxy-6-metoxy-1,4-benzoquinol methylase
VVKSDHSTSEWYIRYYEEKGNDRNDLLRNPGVLFQALSHEASIVYAVRAMNLDPQNARVLDVGCGGGSSIGLYHFLFVMKQINQITC